MMNLRTRIYDSPAGEKMTFGGDCHIFQRGAQRVFPYSLDAVEVKDGNCQHCNRRLSNRYWLRSSDNKRFYVGRECLKKSPGSAAIMVEVLDIEAAARAWRKKYSVPLSEARKRELAFRIAYAQAQIENELRYHGVSPSDLWRKAMCA